MNGVVEIVDGVISGVLDGVVDGLLSGAAEVTIEAYLTDKAGHISPTTKEIYKFQVSDLLGL